MKIVLVGYMGSGKSTVGRALSQQRKIDFLDLDSYIENQEGTSIPELFAEKGELYFRRKEGDYLKEILSQKNNFVLATGGGTPCYGQNMQAILTASDNVIYLKLSLPELVYRLSKEKEERPLIKNVNEEHLLEFIGKHLFERSFFYNQAHFSIGCDGKVPQEIVKSILKKIGAV